MTSTEFDPIAHELNLPSVDTSRYDWLMLADTAITDPDKWLLIDDDGVPATATRVNNGEIAALRDVPGWSFKARSTDVTRGAHRRCKLWLRAVRPAAQHPV